MLSLIGSLQPNPFDPRHTFSSADAIEVAATSQKRVDELRKEDEMEVEDALDEEEMGEVEKVGDLSVLVDGREEDEIEEWTQDKEEEQSRPSVPATVISTPFVAPVSEVAVITSTVPTESKSFVIGESGKKKRKRKDKDLDKVSRMDAVASVTEPESAVVKEKEVVVIEETKMEVEGVKDGREDRPKKKKKRKHVKDEDEASMAVIDNGAFAKPVDLEEARPDAETGVVGGEDGETVKTEKEGKEKKKKRKKEKKEKGHAES